MEQKNSDYCAEIGITYKSNISKDRKKIDSAQSVVDTMMGLEHFVNNIEYKEMFYALYMNSAGKLLSVMLIGEGGIDRTYVETRFILQGAILQNATAIAVVHNHPSGRVQPSGMDKTLTEKINKCCELFSIKLIDHIIISTDNYYSFIEGGDL